FPNGAQYVGSAVLISPHWVLTAGHAIFSESEGGWASSVRVVPAFENGEEPYCFANAHWFHSWSGWTQDGNWEWDMGYIELDRPIGCLSGWAGSASNSDDAYFTNNIFNNPGYPAVNPYNGQQMFIWSGTYDQATANILYINSNSFGGQSGSGSYDQYLRVHAIQSHIETSSSGQRSGQVRLTSHRFNSIWNTINGTTPSSYDLVPLAAYATGSIPGGRLSSGGFLIYNYSSQAWSGYLTYDVYISENSTITNNDTRLQTRSIYVDLDPHERSWINFEAPLPLVPDWVDRNSNYYIGVNITNQDFQIQNNQSSGCDAAQINFWTTPIEKEAAIVNINLYPNPAKASFVLNLEVKSGDLVTVCLYDSQGRKITTFLREKRLPPGKQEFLFDLDDIGQGLYRLEVRGPSGSKFIPLLIQ
ncbi:MAG: T9SS type A sorting domain-containing protein, partial [Bacteroidota bacterium]